ncbi:hypothetical protein Tco_1571557 [Tanacetum coccineum]|uniref:Uncharacterized protein n=1 Tax=Tanacetum coccineum TaxID=301880 RepID=A0ABQ4WAJ9_9ASTR
MTPSRVVGVYLDAPTRSPKSNPLAVQLPPNSSDLISRPQELGVVRHSLLRSGDLVNHNARLIGGGIGQWWRGYLRMKSGDELWEREVDGWWSRIYCRGRDSKCMGPGQRYKQKLRLTGTKCSSSQSSSSPLTAGCRLDPPQDLLVIPP